jgi:hypothetical protein
MRDDKYALIELRCIVFLTLLVQSLIFLVDLAGVYILYRISVAPKMIEKQCVRFIILYSAFKTLWLKLFYLLCELQMFI